MSDPPTPDPADPTGQGAMPAKEAIEEEGPEHQALARTLDSAVDDAVKELQSEPAPEEEGLLDTFFSFNVLHISRRLGRGRCRRPCESIPPSPFTAIPLHPPGQHRIGRCPFPAPPTGRRRTFPPNSLYYSNSWNPL